MTSIILNSITGLTYPYDIYVCDVYGNNCGYISQINTPVPASVEIVLPPPFSTAPAVGIKIITSDGCERFRIIDCIYLTPTPTNTVTPTPTPTNTTTPTPTNTTTPTPTNTTTPTPTNTTTPTPTPITLYGGTISSSSDPTDGCLLTTSIPVYVSNIGGPSGSESITTLSVIYTDSGGTTPFIGDGDYYKIQITGSSIFTSSEIDSSGNVIGSISLC
jgi:hypothetical protein